MRKRETDRLRTEAEKTAETAAAEAKKTRHVPKRMSKKELRAFLGGGNYPEDAGKKELVELAEEADKKAAEAVPEPDLTGL